MSEPDAHASYLPRPSPVASRARVEVGRAAKYGVVGVCNVAIDFTLYALLVTLGVWYPIAKALSLTVATLNGYTFNRRWTFRAGDHQRHLLARYVIVQVSCYAANVALLAWLIEGMDQSKIVAQLIMLPFIAGASFLAQRLSTFGRVVG